MSWPWPGTLTLCPCLPRLSPDTVPSLWPRGENCSTWYLSQTIKLSRFISPDLTLTAGSPSLRAVRAGWGVVSFTEQQVEEGDGGEGVQEGAKEENWKHRGQEASCNTKFNEPGSLYN